MIGLVVPFKKESLSLIPFIKDMDFEETDSFRVITGSIGESSVRLIHCGMGNKFSYQAAKLLIDLFHPKYIVHFGIGGAISPNVKVGDLIVATKVNGSFLNEEFAAKLISQLESSDHSSVAGEILSVNKPVMDAEEAKKLFEELEVLAVDCESNGCMKACEEGDTPLLVLRGISDLANAEAQSQVAENLAGLAQTLGTQVAQFISENP